MGAMEFECTGYGNNAQDAFNNAKQEALYEEGHGSYTGTIAEKHSFKIIPCNMNLKEIEAKIEECMQDYSHFVQDKWGPAGAIKVSKNTWVFFGVASS